MNSFSIRDYSDLSAKQKIGFFIMVSALVLFPSYYLFNFSLESVIVSLLFLVYLILSPKTMRIIFRSWMVFGDFLGRVISPIILALIFFVLITPVALLGRIAGRDPLRLKPRAISSYWVKREPAGPTPDSFKNQF